MNEDTLKDVLAHERREDDFSKDLPFRYMEVCLFCFDTFLEKFWFERNEMDI